MLAADGTFLPDDRLIELFRAAGIDGPASVGVYCGSGITASVLLAALSVAGIDAALFPGSWSQWSSEPNRSVALGPE